MSQSIPFQSGTGEAPLKATNTERGASPEQLPTEVEIPKRRRFSASYKQQILNEAESAPHGGIGEILRREGLTHAHLQMWRTQLRRGSLEGLKVGRKPKSELERENEQLKLKNMKLQSECEKLELIVEYQRKVGLLLGEAKAQEPKS